MQSHLLSLVTEGPAPVAAATGITAYAWLLIALPALGAALLLVGGRRLDGPGPMLANLLSWGSFVIGAAIFLVMLGRDGTERAAQLDLWDFVPAGQFQLTAGLLVDQLSISFVLLITFVGSLIHTYSLGYMEHDPDKRRFFAYLNLFVAAMLLLVLGDSYLTLFVGWEGVGLTSYLLIGFWNHVPDYASAGNKAFFANRVGDVGMLLAMMLMFATFGSVTFESVNAGASSASSATLTAMGLLLLVGACAKSAQFPLQSWLGDAMAGPTPVSALIHAATMVTAGVYLVIRSHVIFEGAPTAQLVVAIVGAITLLYGAIVGCAKDDIKKALAASTMSQIGYMMLAAGLGPIGYAFAIFHLLTHGFFKAGLFLGAGSVMHGMNDQVDMRRFGRLSGVMRITWATFGIGWLAILGIPPFAGFWSKDKIIESAFAMPGARGWILGLITILGAGITAFYMSRLFFMTFHGKEKRWTDDVDPHEAPLTMTIPMVVLAVGSGLLGLVLAVTGFSGWLHPVFGGERHAEHTDWLLMGVTLVVVLAGLALAYRMYWLEEVPKRAPKGSLLTQAARADLYQDEINEGLFMRPGNHLTRALVFTDNKGVDGLAGGLAATIGGWSSRMRRIQNGYARSYALTMLTGVVAILGALWVMN